MFRRSSAGHTGEIVRGETCDKAEKVNNRVGKALDFMPRISDFLLERII